ncbi:MAG: hypothetical protein GMKNLPBB_00832 [Myxococcota bacterium]|nr:hypothetical protein [Myxococcota bacterium]
MSTTSPIRAVPLCVAFACLLIACGGDSGLQVVRQVAGKKPVSESGETCSAEVCDGVDNDCNGETDDFVTDCRAGEACQAGACVSTGAGDSGPAGDSGGASAPDAAVPPDASSTGDVDTDSGSAASDSGGSGEDGGDAAGDPDSGPADNPPADKGGPADVSTPCQDECPSLGEKRCMGAGVSTCGNHDSDSCREWGAIEACPSGESCNQGKCCEGKESVCRDRQCGKASNRCGDSFDCGSCSANSTCNAQGKCECIPFCGGMQCGDDGCGGSCGNCGAGQKCAQGKCYRDLKHCDICSSAEECPLGEVCVVGGSTQKKCRSACKVGDLCGCIQGGCRCGD